MSADHCMRHLLIWQTVAGISDCLVGVCRKENTPAGRSATTADITHSRQPSSKSQDGVKVSKAAQLSKSTQLYLDLGQVSMIVAGSSSAGS